MSQTSPPSAAPRLSPSRERRFPPWAGILLILAAALGIRLTGALLPRILPDGDALGYLEAARHVARGEGLVTHWTRSLPRPEAVFPRPYQGYPALPILAGLLARAGLPLEAAALGLVLAFLVLGLLAFAGAWRLLWREERGADPPAWALLLPLGLLAFHKHLTVATVEPLTDGPALALGTAVLFFLLLARARKERGLPFLRWVFLAGCAALGGALFRFQALFLLPLGPAWLLLEGRGGKRALAASALYLAPLVAPALLLLGDPSLLEALTSVPLRPAPLAGLAAAFDPSSPHSLFAGLGPLVGFGLAGAVLLGLRGRIGPASPWLLVLLHLAFALAPLLVVRPEEGWIHPWFFADRPALQLLPSLILLAAAPLAVLERPVSRGLLALALLVLLLLSLRASWRYAWKRRRLDAPEIEAALEALRSRASPEEDRILSPETRFLAWRGGFRGFQARDPYSLDQVLQSLPGSGVRWILVCSRWDAALPWAAALAELPPSGIPRPLRLEKETRRGRFRARLFRVLD